MLTGAKFFLTLGYDLQRLDKKHTIFGEVVEGLDVLLQVNEAFCDDEGHPFRVIRIRHTPVLDDPFPNPAGMQAPDASPEPIRLADGRLDDEEPLDADEGLDEEAREERRREEEARARTDVLVMVGDLGSEKEAPPENVLFVCKLNPATEEEDLEIIFSQFGKVVGCEIIRDRVTNDSLGFGFIEFGDKAACEKAYLKMDAVVIDDRRIHVDFSQSTSRNTKAGAKGRYGNLVQKGGRGQEPEPPRRIEARRAPARRGQGYDMVFEEGDAVGSKRSRHGDERPRKDARRDDREDPRRGYGSRDRSHHRSGREDRGPDRRNNSEWSHGDRERSHDEGGRRRGDSERRRDDRGHRRGRGDRDRGRHSDRHEERHREDRHRSDARRSGDRDDRRSGDRDHGRRRESGRRDSDRSDARG